MPVGVGVGDGVDELSAFRATAMVAHPPLFIEAVSAAAVPAEPRVLSAAATPKLVPGAYWFRTRALRSFGRLRFVFSTAKKPTYTSLLSAVVNEHRIGAVPRPWLVQ